VRTPRVGGSARLRYQFEDFCLDAELRELRRGSDVVALEPQVFDLLEHLIRNRERVVSKDDLIAAVWNGRIVSESALTTRINAARTAVGDSGKKQRLIRTLPRKGVRFVGAVREDQQGAIQAVEAGDVTAESSLMLPDKPSIAVLPFNVLQGGADDEAFADGLTEDIITSISRISTMFVIARNSTFIYKGNTVEVKQVSRDLGVRFVLEGSIRHSGDRMRITAQLVDAVSANHVWADKYDCDGADLFSVQDEVAQKVAAQVQAEIRIYDDTEVAPVSWTPDLWSFRSPQWQESTRPMRRNSAGR
jgi:TolB-like protein